MKKFCLCTLLLLFSLFTAASAAYAFGAFSQESFVLRKGETHQGDLVIKAGKVVIEGSVDGDVYLFTKNAQVLGEIKGDLLTFSQNTNIAGVVEGDIRAFTEQMTVSGTVKRNVTVSTPHLLITETGKIDGNILAAVRSIDILGKVGREVNGLAGNLMIAGQIGQGIGQLKTESLKIESTAVIQGDINYTSPERAVIAKGAQITGKEIFTEGKPDRDHLFFPFFSLLASAICTLVLWLLIRYLFPGALARTHRHMEGRVLTNIGVGVILFFMAPLLAFVLLFTVVGIPLGLSLLAIMILLFYVAKIFVGTWIGHLLVKRLQVTLHPLWIELIGVVTLLFLTSIPMLGWLFSWVIWVFFLGTVAIAIRRMNRSISV